MVRVRIDEIAESDHPLDNSFYDVIRCFEIDAVFSDLLSTLKPRERFVLIKRFGLKGSRMYSLGELAGPMNITKQAVALIEAKILRKMRHPTRIRKLHKFWED